MIDLKLFINNKEVDLYPDETLQINDKIQDSKSFASVFSGFSESYTVPATQRNNDIFKHYYRFDINNGFDANVRQNAIIKVNGVDKYKGFIQLEEVSLKNEAPKDYTIIFTSFISILKQKIKEDTLRSVYNLHELGISDEGTIFNKFDDLSSNLCYPVKNLTNGVNELNTTNDYNLATVCRPIFFNRSLVFDGSKWIDQNEQTYALTSMRFDSYSCRAILKQIFDFYGLNVDNTFFESTPFNELFLYAQPTEVEPGEGFEGLNSNDYYIDSNKLTLSTGGDVLDSNGILSIGDKQKRTIRFYVSTNTITQGDTTNIIIRDKISGQNLLNETLEVEEYIDPSDNSTVRTGFVARVELKGVRDYDLQFISAGYKRLYANENYIRIDDTLYKGEIPTVIQGVSIRNAMPPINIIDFIDGLFKIYNLTLFEKLDGTVKIQTLDDFYNTGKTKDLTNYVDIDKSTIKRVDGFSEIDFSYNKAETAAIELQNALSDNGYGNLKYKEKTSISTSKYSVSNKFNLILPERLNTTSGNDVVVARNINKEGEEVFNPGLIFYVKQRTSSNTGFAGLTTYNSVSNVASDDTTLFYGVENDVDNKTRKKSLFLTYFSKYVKSIYDNKVRLIEVTAYLPLDFILEYQLNDTIIINNRKYRIEELNININTGKTNLTLNNIPQVEDNINLYLDVYPVFKELTSASQTYSFLIDTNTSWEITNIDPFVTFSKTSGEGSQTIVVTVTENTGSDRSDLVLITGKDVASIEYVIKQKEPAPPSTLSISPTTASVDYNAQDIELTITSNTSWDFTSSDTWIKEPILFDQSGNKVVNVSIEQNNASTSRSGTLTVTTDDGTQSEALSITQGAFVSPSLTEVTLGLGSNSGEACSQLFSSTYYINASVLNDATKIYTDSSGSTLAPAQIYSDGVTFADFDGTIIINKGNC